MNYDLCFGRDTRGCLQTARVPEGLAAPGMMLRLLGGKFLLVEWVGREEGTEESAPVAAELLSSVWRRGQA